MPINRLISCIAVGLEIIDFIWFIIRGKKNSFCKKEELSKQSIVKIIIIYVCVILLPVICFFIDFGMVGNIAICGCSVLGIELVSRDLLVIEKKRTDIFVSPYIKTPWSFASTGWKIRKNVFLM